MQKLGAKKVAVLYNDDPYGVDLSKLVAGELSRLGAQVALSQQVKVEQNRFTDEVKKIAAAGVDAIYYAGYEVECPYLRADLRDAGLDKLTFMASDGCFLARDDRQLRRRGRGHVRDRLRAQPQVGGGPELDPGLPGGRLSQPGHVLDQRLQRHAGAGGRGARRPAR